MAYQRTLKDDDFGDDFEKLYETMSAPESHEATNGSIGRQTSFLDLPGELRNVIYALAIRRTNPLKIGFKHVYDAPEHLQIPMDRRPASYPAFEPLFAQEIESVQQTKVTERPTALASAIPLLKKEVLEIHYAENTFRMRLRHTLDRRRCAQWIADRGSLLIGVRSVRLHMPVMMTAHRCGCVISIRLPDDSTSLYHNQQSEDAIVESTISNEYYSWNDCRCRFDDLIRFRLSKHGRHPDSCFAEARAVDAGPVMAKVLEICEAGEWVEQEDWLRVQECVVNRFADQDSKKTKNGECENCGMRAVFVM